MRTKQVYGMLWSMMIALLLMMAVFTPYMAAGEEAKAGEMTLLQAAKDGDTETVKTFIERGIDVNAQYKDGLILGPVRWIVNALLTGKDTKTRRGDTALIVAARWGHADIVRILLEAGAKVNAKNQNGTTALMAAERGGYDEIVEMLKKSGAKE